MFGRLLKLQGGKCKICKTLGTPQTPLVVDHNHKTLLVRGLLCSPCNSALGLFYDDLKRLRAAIRYLKRGPLMINNEPLDYELTSFGERDYSKYHKTSKVIPKLHIPKVPKVKHTEPKADFTQL